MLADRYVGHRLRYAAAHQPFEGAMGGPRLALPGKQGAPALPWHENAAVNSILEVDGEVLGFAPTRHHTRVRCEEGGTKNEADQRDLFDLAAEENGFPPGAFSDFNLPIRERTTRPARMGAG